MPERPSPDPPTSDVEAARPLPVLLAVEDEPHEARLLDALFEEEYRLLHAEEPSEALELLIRESVDLVLTDLSLARGGDGLDLVRAIRELGRKAEASVPIIVVTGRTDGQTIEECFRTGANDYVAKPFREHEMLARVRFHTAYRRQAAERAADRVRIERLNTAIRMAGAIAHEVNNPLSAIIGYCDLIRQDLASEAPDLESIASDLGRVRQQATRIAEVIRRLSDLKEVTFRQYVGDDEIVDLEGGGKPR